MWRCPVCEKEHIQGSVCDDCGFDSSCDYEQNRILCSVLPRRIEPVSVRAAKWRQQQKQMIAVSPGNLVCPKCGGKHFFFLIDEPQFMCTDCETKMSITIQKDEPVSESDPFVENKTADTSEDLPVTDPVPAKADTTPAGSDETPPVSDESSRGGRDLEPAARTGQGSFRSTSGLLWVYFWIYLAAAAGLVLLAWSFARTYQYALRFVPMMLLSAVFYVVSAVFVLFCRRRIRELPDTGSADSVRRTTVFFGTLILIHVLLTALHQFIVLFGPDVFWRVSVMLLNVVFCVVSAAFVFRRRRHIREMLDAGLTDSVRRTAVFFGTLILIRILLSAIPYFIGWIDPASFDFFYRFLF